MRLVIQRVSSASVTVANKVVGQIEHGLMVLVGFHQTDINPDLKKMANKLVELRIFSNAEGRFDLSVKDLTGALLLVPQFTLFANTEKGRRPDFFEALKPDLAKQHFHNYIEAVKTSGLKVEAGVFGAEMQVQLCNEGPVTIIIDG